MTTFSLSQRLTTPMRRTRAAETTQFLGNWWMKSMQACGRGLGFECVRCNFDGTCSRQMRMDAAFNSVGQNLNNNCRVCDLCVVNLCCAT